MTQQPQLRRPSRQLPQMTSRLKVNVWDKLSRVTEMAPGLHLTLQVLELDSSRVVALLPGLQGKRFFAFGAQAGLAAASTGVSIAYNSWPGILAGILGGQVALTAETDEALGEDAVEAFGKSIPVVGAFVSAGALVYDGYQTYKAYSGCLTGVHE
jgi:hypothetical protein